jgi:hypothetical protein
MKLLTGLFRFARKRIQTTDNDMGMFREKLNELVEKKAELPDEEVARRVDELKEMTIDLPDEEEKSKLDRFLEDFKSVKEQDDATAKEAANMVADLFEKLDTQAMKDVPEVPAEEEPAGEEAEDAAEPESLGGYMKENIKSDIKNVTKDEDEGEEVAEETVEETTAPEGEGSSNADYTLEEIYQFIKKRMAEDAAAETEEESEEEIETEAEDSAEEVEEKKEDEEEEVVTDHAPRIPVTMNRTAAKGSLADMFNTIKGGR